MWFQSKLADKQLSQRQLAKHIGLDPAAVSLMLRGKRKMTADEAGSVAKLLGVPVDEVLRHAGVTIAQRVSTGRVPVVGWINEQGAVIDERPPGPSVAEAPAECVDDVVALRIVSHEMFDGWLAFYRPMESVSLEAVGRLCIVELEDGRKLFRGVRRGYEPGFYGIGGWFVDRADNVRLVSASPVLWMRQ